MFARRALQFAARVPPQKESFVSEMFTSVGTFLGYAKTALAVASLAKKLKNSLIEQVRFCSHCLVPSLAPCPLQCAFSETYIVVR